MNEFYLPKSRYHFVLLFRRMIFGKRAIILSDFNVFSCVSSDISNLALRKSSKTCTVCQVTISIYYVTLSIYYLDSGKFKENRIFRF